MVSIKPVIHFEALELVKSMRKSGRRQKLLDEFISSGYICAEVEYQHHYANIDSARCGLIHTAKNSGLVHIKVCRRKGKLYLINTLLIGQKKIE